MEKQLRSLSRIRVSLLLILSAASLGVANYLVQPSGIHLNPLFVLPVCLAVWHTSFRAALAVAAISAMTSVASDIEISFSALQDVMGNIAIHTVSVAIIAVTVWRFRASYEEQRFLARHDGVTGILNRQTFEHEAQAMLRVACRQGWPMLLVYLDLDGFKSINDRHGHEAGDNVLRRFGMEGRMGLRRDDCFGRMGGDEFAVLMKLPSMDEGQQVANKLHRRFSAALADTGHEVTCSMGALTILPDVEGIHMDELMRNADRLMYAAKRGGKNGIRYATSAWLVDQSLTPFTDGKEMTPILFRPNKVASVNTRAP